MLHTATRQSGPWRSSGGPTERVRRLQSPRTWPNQPHLRVRADL